MGFFTDDGDEMFDLFLLDQLDKQNKQSGGCILSLLMIFALPALLAAGVIIYFH